MGMKKNLFDYFNSSQDIKLETCSQENGMLEGATQEKETIVSSGENNTNSKVQIQVSLDSSLLSELENEWSQESTNNVKKIKKEKITKENKDNESIKTPKKEIRYSFLEDIKDKNGRSVDECGYDSSSLFISDQQLSSLTPFEKQFWEIKKEYFDTIVFFKKGKFYELYEDDADISAKLFNMKVTERVNMRMTGFPESSYDEWACKFLEAGYKIARVDQSENAIGKQIREKDGKKDKIITRELKEVITQGTIYDINHLKNKHASYLCALRKNLCCQDPKNCKSDDSNSHFSLVLYDASTSTIYASTFCDDKFFTSLRGFFLKYPIMEYLSDKKLDFGTIWIKPNKKLVVSEARKHFHEEEYECYCMIYNYLEYLKREDNLKNCQVQSLEGLGKLMKLETSTIINMDLFETAENNKTLFNAINFCLTPGGERLLRNWLLHPLNDYLEIQKRQKLSELLGKLPLNKLRDKLKVLGDVERMLSKLSNGRSSLKDLNVFLDMLRKIVCIYEELENVLHSQTKESCTINTFMELESIELEKYYATFSLKKDLNRSLALFLSHFTLNKEEILPGKNNNDELNILLKDKETLESTFQIYLEKQRKALGCDKLVYKSIGKEIYQIEVPKEVKSLPKDWYLVSTTKSSNRYYTKDLPGMIKEYVEIGERIFQSQGCLLNRAIQFLLKYTGPFQKAIRDINQLDCLHSFSMFIKKNECCKPEIGTRISIKGLRNPIYPNYIVNDYEESNRIVVLTGSNMSGKSTFMRSITLNIILYQMGMYVCADRFSCPLFDRLFTRIGASDNLNRGESTFMVELSEMSTVFRYATSSSFVVVDELGRGTSAKDGKGIAKAVIEKLKAMGCYVFFSTHYHNLVNDVTLCFMDSRIVDNNLVFLYKLTKGECKNSNGIYVAKLAGVPEEVVKGAWEYRDKIVKGHL